MSFQEGGIPQGVPNPSKDGNPLPFLPRIEYSGQYPDPLLYPEFNPGVFQEESRFIYVGPGKMRWSVHSPLVTWGAKSCSAIFFQGDRATGLYHRIPEDIRTQGGETNLPSAEEVRLALGDNIRAILFMGDESHPFSDSELEFVQELGVDVIRRVPVESGKASSFGVAYRQDENTFYVDTFLREKAPTHRFITTYSGF